MHFVGEIIYGYRIAFMNICIFQVYCAHFVCVGFRRVHRSVARNNGVGNFYVEILAAAQYSHIRVVGVAAAAVLVLNLNGIKVLGKTDSGGKNRSQDSYYKKAYHYGASF